MPFTRSSACFSRSFGAGVEAENQRGDADEPGGGDQPEEAGTAATVRAGRVDVLFVFVFCFAQTVIPPMYCNHL